MTEDKVKALHNPFIKRGRIIRRWRFRRELQIDCASHAPDISLVSGTAVALAFPDQAWIDLVSDVDSVTALFIDRPKARDMSVVSKLLLTNLTMSYPSHVRDWGFLRELRTLKRLSLHNMLSLQNLDDLMNLGLLEVFELSGGYEQTLCLPSLRPLRELKSLKAVLLANVRCADCSLEPLVGLPELRRFDAPLWWPKEELRRLMVHNAMVRSNITETA